MTIDEFMKLADFDGTVSRADAVSLYEQGRADERAAVIIHLISYGHHPMMNSNSSWIQLRTEAAAEIERGEHLRGVKSHAP